MKITLRILMSLIFVVAIVTFVFSFHQVSIEKARMTGDLIGRIAVLADSLHESIIPLLNQDGRARLKRLVERFGNRERLEGVIVYDPRGKIISSSPDLSSKLEGSLPQAVTALAEKRTVYDFISLAGKNSFVYVLPLTQENELRGVLAIFYDASYIDIRLREIWRYNLLRFLILSAVIAAFTLFVIQWSIRGPIARVAEWIKDLRLGRGRSGDIMNCPRGDIVQPLLSEVQKMAKSLAVARARTEEEARLRLRGESLWTAERLKEHMRTELRDKKLFLVSNREPYMSVKEGRTIKCIVPAGGLVTALDPVMKICDGLWIAHGSGDADRDTVDSNNKLRVPPENPSYTLKRIWLTKEEEKGYYYGFSNEGIWPLCHITHIRPAFRLDDWMQYQKVNQDFSDALLKEIEDQESPLVLVQDYHLALVPILVKTRRPDAKISLFWHIPWPNPEAYGICPWREEILLGMIGADIIGFHIQFHCNNFLDTVDRFLESKIDWEQFSITRGGQTTLVKPFPVSVPYQGSEASGSVDAGVRLKENLLKEMGVQADYMGIGVDRLDYTKGIVERFRVIERFLEKFPEYIGKFTFIQIGAPSRTHIKQYRDFVAEVEETVERINWRFQSKTWVPIILRKRHHSHEEILPFYKAADVCMVTSLHDGMNLVAKEFVAARDDEEGALILSQFAGASRELTDAFIVNPYDIEGTADALKASLLMPIEERRTRMKHMRETVKERNIYFWASDIITSLARLR